MCTRDWKAHLYRIGILTTTIIVAGGLYALLSGTQTSRSPDDVHFIGEHPLHGQEAPDFALEQMNGQTFRLSDHRGEVVVVNFWATWCPPCRHEVPGFVELQEELGEEGLTFVGVSLDEEGFEVVRPFAEEMDINYPLVVDDGTVASQFGGVPALPTTFVVGSEGEVQFARPGFLPEAELRTRLEPLLKNATPRS